MADAKCIEFPVEELRKLFRYDPETGKLYWKVSRPNVRGKAGDKAGNLDGKYLRVKVKGRSYLVHRIIWAIVKGYWPRSVLDHRDLNKLNNRIENLREATKSQNRVNSGVQKNSRSKLKGVKPHGKRWVARIPCNGKTKHLGVYATPEEAAKVYDAECRRLHGEFAKTNY